MSGTDTDSGEYNNINTLQQAINNDSAVNNLGVQSNVNTNAFSQSQNMEDDEESQSFDIPNPFETMNGKQAIDELINSISIQGAKALKYSKKNVLPVLRRTFYNLKTNFTQILEFALYSFKETLRQNGVTEQTIDSLVGNPETEQLNYLVAKLYQKLDGNVNVILNCDELEADKKTMTEYDFIAYKQECIAGNNLTDMTGVLSLLINRAFFLHQLILRNLKEKQYNAKHPAAFDIREPNENARILFLIQLLLSPTGPDYQLVITDSELKKRYAGYTRFRDELMNESPEQQLDSQGEEAIFNPQLLPQGEKYSSEYGPSTLINFGDPIPDYLRAKPNPYPRMKEAELARIQAQRKRIQDVRYGRDTSKNAKDNTVSSAPIFKRTGTKGGKVKKTHKKRKPQNKRKTRKSRKVRKTTTHKKK